MQTKRPLSIPSLAHRYSFYGIVLSQRSVNFCKRAKVSFSARGVFRINSRIEPLSQHKTDDFRLPVRRGAGGVRWRLVFMATTSGNPIASLAQSPRATVHIPFGVKM